MSDDDTVTITGSSSIDSSGYTGSVGTMSSLTVPSITTYTGTGATGALVYTVGGGGGGVGGSGAIGHTGSYFTGTGPGWTTISPQTNSVFNTSKGNKVDLDELAEMMKIMKERFLILTPLFEKHEKYAALKKAYDNYKMIEALIQEDRKDD
jgi:hypothetical protein